MNESFKRPPTLFLSFASSTSQPSSPPRLHFSSQSHLHLILCETKLELFVPFYSYYASMASAMAISEPGGSSKGRERRKKEAESKWKTEIQERLYSCKLVEAIRFAGGSSCSPPPKSSSLSPAPSRIVREAADRALAVAARGRSRWSRAILSRRKKMRVRKATRKAAAGVGQPRFPAAGGVDSEMGVEKRVRALGRLVPGGRKLPLSTLLEETADYIAAVEMQVRAMTALSELLSSSSSTSTAAVANVGPC